MTVRFFVLFTALICCARCDRDEAKLRAEKIAAAYCQCTTPLMTLNQKAAGTQPEDMSAYLNAVQTAYNTAKQCNATAILAVYGKLNAEERARVNKVLEKKCPDLATQNEWLLEMLGE